MCGHAENQLNKLARRACGRTSLTLPVLTLGSARFDPRRIDPEAGRNLLAYLFEAGADAVHSSHEYEFHDYFCETLRSLGKRRVIHIVKLGEPHFDHAGFRPERMIDLVDRQLSALRTDRLDIVQWLLRHTPLEDRYRLPLFEACRDEVAATLAKLIEAGKIGAVTVFPYTPRFAEATLPLPWCSGLTTYLNAVERECVPFLDAMQGSNQFCVAIRPFLGGKLTDCAAAETVKFASACHALGIGAEDRLVFALRYPLLHPAVSSVMLSISSRAHAEAVLKILSSARNVEPDPAMFNRANAAFAVAGL
jgi:aryl-alcohol dehydrogenase-like predicted oxidoreductase